MSERLGDRPYCAALTTLTWIATRTERLRLGTSVLVVPYLNPLVLAKAVATLDVFSGGRVTLGVGVGGPAENRALGSDYSTRGAYANKSIGCSSFRTTLIFNNNNYLGEYGHAPRCRFVAYMRPAEPYVQTKGA